MRRDMEAPAGYVATVATVRLLDDGAVTPWALILRMRRAAARGQIRSVEAGLRLRFWNIEDLLRMRGRRPNLGRPKKKAVTATPTATATMN